MVPSFQVLHVLDSLVVSETNTSVWGKSNPSVSLYLFEVKRNMCIPAIPKMHGKALIKHKF